MNFKQRKSGLLVPRHLDGMRVRDRFAPATKVGARMEGRIHYQLIGRDGKVKQEGEMHNLVLDQGLDYVASYDLGVPIFAYCAVGTGSTAPAATDTGLVAELARTNTTWQGDTYTRTSNGVYDITRYFEFTYGAANGNLTEFGMSPGSAAGTNLFSRALFVDGGGTPTPVTKTSSEKLRVNYTLTVTLTPVVMTAGSFTIANIGVITGNYTLVKGSQTRIPNPDLGVFRALSHSGLSGAVYLAEYPGKGGLGLIASDQSGATYNSDYEAINTTYTAHGVPANRDLYTLGSYQRTGGSWMFETGYGNYAQEAYVICGGVYSDGISSYMSGGYVFDLDAASVFTKDSLHTLSIGAPTVTWSR